MAHWLRIVGLLGDPRSVASTHVSKPSVGLVSKLPHPLISAGTRHAHVLTYIHAGLVYFFKPKGIQTRKVFRHWSETHMLQLSEEINVSLKTAGASPQARNTQTLQSALVDNLELEEAIAKICRAKCLLMVRGCSRTPL